MGKQTVKGVEWDCPVEYNKPIFPVDDMTDEEFARRMANAIGRIFALDHPEEFKQIIAEPNEEVRIKKYTEFFNKYFYDK